MKRVLFFLFALCFSFSPDLYAEEAVIPTFEIRQFLLEGNTLLPPEKTLKILSVYTGKNRDFADIQHAIEQLENAYKNLGYTMVTVLLPEQELSGGLVRLQIIEPKVTDIKIEGNNFFSRENIVATVPTLKTAEVPRVTAISENLRAANENPAKKITLQFKPEDDPKNLVALLQVKDQKPWKVNLSGDNTGSDATGLYRASLGFQHFNLFDLDHVAAIQYTTSPDHIDKVNIFSGSYRIPFYKLGDTLDVFGAYSDVDSGTTQISGTDLKVSGKGVISGFRYNMNLPRFAEYEQKLIAGMDYRLYDNSAVIENNELATDVVAHPLTIAYGGVWTTELLTVDGSLGLLYNIPWGNKGEKADFIAFNDAAANYFIMRYGLNFMYHPGGDWIVRLATNGQYTPDRLISGEQFGYGGSAVLRGYEEREESWDNGLSGSLELYSPDFSKVLKTSESQLRLLAFIDAGKGYNLHTQSGEIDNNYLTSAGAGLRFGYKEMFSFTLDWGFALEDATVADGTKRGDNAVHFKGQISY